jgi:hypothetical protein
MGFILPAAKYTHSMASNDNTERARALIARRTTLEAEMAEHMSILRQNGVDMKTPLVDAEGQY